MKKHTARKPLHLSAETVRQLESSALTTVAGGDSAAVVCGTDKTAASKCAPCAPSNRCYTI